MTSLGSCVGLAGEFFFFVNPFAFCFAFLAEATTCGRWKGASRLQGGRGGGVSITSITAEDISLFKTITLQFMWLAPCEWFIQL